MYLQNTCQTDTHTHKSSQTYVYYYYSQDVQTNFTVSRSEPGPTVSVIGPTVSECVGVFELAPGLMEAHIWYVPREICQSIYMKPKKNVTVPTMFNKCHSVSWIKWVIKVINLDIVVCLSHIHTHLLAVHISTNHVTSIRRFMKEKCDNNVNENETRGGFPQTLSNRDTGSQTLPFKYTQTFTHTPSGEISRAEAVWFC